MDFEDLINEYGHDVYIRRRLDGAEYVDGQEGLALHNNDKYSDELERHTAYRRMESRFNVFGQPMVPQGEGYVSDLMVRFAFKPGALIKSNDMIYEQTPHERHEWEQYLVTRAVPLYIKNELKYFLVHAKRLNPVT